MGIPCGVVERTLAWLGRSRHLSKDYERLPSTRESLIEISMSHLMLLYLSTGFFARIVMNHHFFAKTYQKLQEIEGNYTVKHYLALFRTV